PDALLAQCANAGLRLIAELDLTRFALNHPLVEAHPHAFALRRTGRRDGPIDSRAPQSIAGEARARPRSPETVELLREPLSNALAAMVERGVGGFRLASADRVPADFIEHLVTSLRSRAPDVVFLAGAPDLSRPQARALAGAGFDALISSFAWWDLRAPWLIEEYEELRPVAPLLSEISSQALVRADTPGVLR